MIYLYTTEPDELCHKVSEGIYGRPVNTYAQPGLRKLGWVSDPATLKVESHVRNERKTSEEASEKGQEEAHDEVTDLAVWSAAYNQKFGRRPHHRMKVDTIRREVEES